MGDEELRPKCHSAIDDIDEPDGLAPGQLYFETRDIEVAAEILGEGAPMRAGFVNARCVFGDFRVLGLNADVLQICEFGACLFDVILELPQRCKLGTVGQRGENVIAEMPSLQSAIPRQLPVEIVFLKVVPRRP